MLNAGFTIVERASLKNRSNSFLKLRWAKSDHGAGAFIVLELPYGFADYF